MSFSHRKLKEKHFRIKDKISGYDKELVLKTFRLPNGSLENFFIDKSRDSVQVLALTPDFESVICVECFRAGPEKTQLELPGGSIEEGEKPEEAALRELKEESSYEPKSKEVYLVAEMDYSPYSSGKRYTYLALDCVKSKAGQDLDPNEFLKVVILPQEAFRKKMLLGLVRGTDVAYMAFDKLGIL